MLVNGWMEAVRSADSLAEGIWISKPVNGYILIVSKWQNRGLLVDEQLDVGSHIS